MLTAEVTTTDPAFMLAELVLRLRHAGVDVPADRGSMEAAHLGMVEVLAALGVPTGAGALADVDYLLLLCAAARGA